MHIGVSKRWAMLAALLAGMLVAAGPSGPVTAAPAPGQDDEGGSNTLREQLDAASRGFLAARTAMAASQRRQAQLATRLGTVEKELAARSAVVGRLVGVAYRGGRKGPMTALLTSDTPQGLIDQVATLDVLAANENAQVRDLLKTRADVTRARAAVAAEIAGQRKQMQIMTARKKQAERALVAVGAGQATSGPNGGVARAKPAPRESDGSLPSQGCSIDDPTTGGCITPRTRHALNQAKAAGFTRFVSCFRNGGSGEHPKGRACDFAAQRNGFGGVATGGDRTYGDNLAAYFVRNADRLGVLYVIWFKKIWLPSSGWRTYGRAGGDPSSDHTNHVHLSVV
ncbi:MAG TPA: hypothetical protein VES42_19900 [Pilimelia sp.]|nr:hypothetical protein [Pilimelia sp.]